MSEPWITTLLRKIPAVHQILAQSKMLELNQKYGHDRLVVAIQSHLEKLRREILGAESWEALDRIELSPEGICEAVQAALISHERLRFLRVINASGVVLHTNLGRAPLAREAIEAIERVAGGYSNLELNLETGKRGKRYDHVRELLIELTGAEDALVVNNNAAAVLLVLSALARGREVIVSRGELVEIGGAFRVPEVMSQSGAQMVEVGTTNKTKLSDYERAISPETGLLLKVHPSNYRIIGFTETVEREDLVDLAQKHNLPVVEDLGSGVLIEQNGLGYFFGEPTVQSTVRSGVDVVTFSGDKLLGGPQGGIIVGRRDLIGKIASHPLNRALRVDKLTLAALEATLQLYRNPQSAMEKIPALQYIFRHADEIAERAHRLRVEIQESHTDWKIDVLSAKSQVGGGSLPDVELPSWCVVIQPPQGGTHELAEILRKGEVPVMGRLQEDALWLDLRTVSDEDELELRLMLGKAMTEIEMQRKGAPA